MAVVLFHRGISPGQDSFQTLAPYTVNVSGGPKIQKLCLQPVCNDDIIRLDIPVNDLFGVDSCQGIHNRLDEHPGFLPGNGSSFFTQVFGQTDSLNIFHDKISGAVARLLKIAVDLYNVGNSDKLRQRLRFLQELGFAVFKIIAALSAIGKNSMSGGSCYDRAWIVFLDCDQIVGHIIQGFIGDSKSPLSKDIFDDISAVEDTLLFKGSRIIRITH